MYGDIRTGDYRIDGDLLRSLALYRDLDEEDFDSDELAAFFKYYDGLSAAIWNHLFYITDTSIAYFDDFESKDPYNLTREQYQKETGSLRVHYKGIERGAYAKIAVVGKPQGNRIVKDPDMDAMTAYENAKSQKDIVRENASFGWIGILLMLIPSVLLLAFGIRLLIRRG